MPDFQITDAPPVPPVCPNDEECCRSGCNPCIFDLYAEELERYRAALRAWEAKHPEKSKNADSIAQ